VACISKGRELNSDEFKWDGLHEKHAVATWEPSQRLLGDGVKARNLCREAGRRTFQLHTDI
jgi:hypothetical protein